MTIPAAATLPTRHVLGFDLVDADDLDVVVAALTGTQPADDRLPVVATPNVDDLVKLHRGEYADLADWERRARYLLPDGQPVVWASRLVGVPLSARLAGADLLPRWWTALAANAVPTLVVAPRRSVADALEQRHPRAVTVVAPRLDPTDPSGTDLLAAQVIDAALAQGSHVIMIGIGFPHQQRLAAKVLEGLPEPRPLVALLGGSFDVFTGEATRAPRWMQRAGMEWAYRLWREPRRLARRYLLDDLAFVPLVWRAWRTRRRGVTP